MNSLITEKYVGGSVFVPLKVHLPEGTEETWAENLRRYCRSLGRDLRPGPTEQGRGILTNHSQRSFHSMSVTTMSTFI